MKKSLLSIVLVATIVVGGSAIYMMSKERRLVTSPVASTQDSDMLPTMSASQNNNASSENYFTIPQLLKYPDKDELLLKAQNGDLYAMGDLNTYYHFVETKTGLAYYQTWYLTALESSDANAIMAFATVLKDYTDMFVNGEGKYETLLQLAAEKGNKDAQFELINYYSDNGTDLQFDELRSLILRDTSQQNLQRLWKLADKEHWDKTYSQVLNIMREKGYINSSQENIIEFNNAYAKVKSNDSTKEDEQRLDKIIDTIIASKSYYDVYTIANTFKTKHTPYKEKVLLAALGLIDDPKQRAQIYVDLAEARTRYRTHLWKEREGYIKYLKEETEYADAIADDAEYNKMQQRLARIQVRIDELYDKREAYSKDMIFEWNQKAADLGHFESMKKVYYASKNDAKYKERLAKVSQQLQQNEQGRKFLLPVREDISYIVVRENIALRGDMDFALSLALINLKSDALQPTFSGPLDIRDENAGKRWRAWLLQTDNAAWHIKMKERLSYSPYSSYKRAQDFLAQLIAREADWENIIVARDEGGIEGREKAAAYGDVKNLLKVASSKIVNGSPGSWEKRDDFTAAQLAEKKKMFDEGILVYNNLAENGDVEAYWKLGRIYTNKEYWFGEMLDYKKALANYEKALELSVSYRLKRNVAEDAIAIYECKSCGLYDMDRVIQILTELADEGDYVACKRLAEIYQRAEFYDIEKYKKYEQLETKYYKLTK